MLAQPELYGLCLGILPNEAVAGRQGLEAAELRAQAVAARLHLVIVAAVRLEAARVLQHLRLLLDKALLLHLVLEVTVVEGVEA